jgi:hypothetical protein
MRDNGASRIQHQSEMSGAFFIPLEIMAFILQFIALKEIQRKSLDTIDVKSISDIILLNIYEK